MAILSQAASTTINYKQNSRSERLQRKIDYRKRFSYIYFDKFLEIKKTKIQSGILSDRNKQKKQSKSFIQFTKDQRSTCHSFGLSSLLCWLLKVGVFSQRISSSVLIFFLSFLKFMFFFVSGFFTLELKIQ